MSHHELEIVDDHMGDVIHVDGVLHGVNHRPGPGGEQDQPGSATGTSRGEDGDAKPGTGTGRGRVGRHQAGADGSWPLTTRP